MTRASPFLLPLLGAFVLARAGSARTACPDARDAKFVNGLVAERRYALAAFQGEALAYAADSCPALPALDLGVAKALYHLGAFDRARAKLAPRLGDPDPRFRRYYLEAWLLDTGHPGAADSCLAWIEAPSAGAWEPGERDRFRAAALFARGDAARARAVWPDGPAGNEAPCGPEGKPECYLAEGIKSPGLAAALSLFPGAGYAYAGQRGDGIYAFTVVTLFYGAAAAYAHFHAPVRAWTLAGFGAVFHVSGMYGSGRAAEAANARRRTGFLMALHRTLFP